MARMKMKKVCETTVEEVFEDFLLSKKAKGTSDKTLETYNYHFRAISKYLDTSADITGLSSRDLETMIAEMRNGNLSATSISSYTRTLKSFLSWCNDKDITTLNISLYKAPEIAKDTYTTPELKKLLQKPNMKNCGFTEFRNWVIVNLLLNSGCRAKTVRTFLVKDVDLNGHRIIYQHTKNGKPQVSPLCDKMVSILREYLKHRGGEANDPLFPNENGKPLTESGLRQAIEAYNLSRGVSKTSIHLYRHTFAGMFLRNGGDALHLQQHLGHSTLKMTKHYCAINDVDLMRNINTFNPLATI